MTPIKRKMIGAAIAAALTGPALAQAADVQTSGFADITYTITDDANEPASGKHPTEGKFAANAEADFIASPADGVTVRVDADLNIGTSITSLGTSNGANYTAINDALGGAGAAVAGPAQGPADSGVIEQAYLAWSVTEAITVIGGVFNDPIGQDAEDKPDMMFASHSQIYTWLDDQTTLYGNNVAGLAVAGNVGPATITLGFLNDLQQSNENNSIAFLVNYSPIQGLDLELGRVDEADATDTSGLAQSTVTVENVTDFNVSYSPAQVAGLSVGLDYATFGEILDNAYDLWVTYKINQFGAGVRSSSTSFSAGGDNWDTTTVDVSYQAASNLKVVLENRTDKNADGTGKSNTTNFLDLIATF